MLQLLVLQLFFCFDLPNDVYSQVLDGRHVFLINSKSKVKLGLFTLSTELHQ